MAFINKEQTSTARKIINKIGKKYGLKFSTTKEGYSSLNVALMAGREVTLEDLNIESYLLDYIKKYGVNDNEDTFPSKMQEFLSAEFYVYNDLYRAYVSIKNVINGEHLSYISIFKDETIFKKAFDEIEKEVKKALGWFDDSDSMTDYFHTAFYFKLSFAKWDKDYKIIKGLK